MTRRRLLRTSAAGALALTGAGVLGACGAEDERTDEPQAATGREPEGFSGRLASVAFYDEAIALGAMPVAAVPEPNGRFRPNLAPQMANVKSLGSNLNLEALIAADPDLIIADTFTKADLGDQLAAIAPSRYVEFSAHGGARGVKEQLEPVAGHLRLEEKGAARFAEHERKLAQARDRLAGVPGTVAFIRVLQKELRLVTLDWGYIGPVIYGDLGLASPPYVAEVNERDAEKVGYVVVSLEVVPRIRPDVLFFLVSEDAQETREEVMGSRLWRDSPAVRNERLFEVNADVWQATGVNTNETKAADVVRALAA